MLIRPDRRRSSTGLRTAGPALLVVLLVAVTIELGSLVVLHVFNDTSRAALLERLAATEPEHAAQDRVGAQAGDQLRHHVLHPYLGYVRDRDPLVTELNGLPVDERINELGFFGPMPRVAGESDGSWDVLIIGGSVAIEFFVKGRDTLRRMIEESGLAAGRDVRILSAALGGLKQPQQVLAVNYLLALGFDFDAVINIDGFNELALPFSENAGAGVHPHFPRAWPLYAAKSLSMETAVIAGEIESLRRKRAARQARMATSPTRFSSFFLSLWDSFERRSEGQRYQLELALRDALLSRDELTYQQLGPAYAYDTPENLFRESAALWRRSSIQLWALARSADMAYFHFLQPNQYVADSKPLTDWERANAIADESYAYRYAVEQAYHFLRAAGDELAKAGVAYVDLVDVFAQVEETVYRDECCHVNDRGNELLARAIVDAMTAWASGAAATVAPEGIHAP